MNKSQLQETLNEIKRIEDLNLDGIITSIYQGRDDIENIMVKDIRIPEFVTIIKRALIQLKKELTDGMGLFLPWQYNYQNEYGNGNITTDLQQLRSFLQSKDLNNACTSLGKIVYYQIANGFYDKSALRVHDLRGLKIKEIEDRANLLAQQLHQSIENYNNQLSLLQNKFKELEDFKNQKAAELQQISNYLQAANQQTKSINDLLNTCTATNEKIDAIHNQQKTNLSNIQDLFNKEGNVFQKYEESLKVLIKTIEDQMALFDEQIKKYQEHLEFVEGKKSFFEERNSYLTQLIGREVGVSLFETFKQRKVELAPSVKFWKWAVPIMTILTVTWIYAVFSHFFGFEYSGPNRPPIPFQIGHPFRLNSAGDSGPNRPPPVRAK